MNTPTADAIVRYHHPTWGAVRGRVLDAGVVREAVLVQDLSPAGAREWWPVAALTVEAEIGPAWTRATERIPPVDGDSTSVEIEPDDWIQRDEEGRIRRVVGWNDEHDLLCAYSLDTDGHAVESMMIDWLRGAEVAEWVLRAAECMPVERHHAPEPDADEDCDRGAAQVRVYPDPPCTLCGVPVASHQRVVGQASGPQGTILHDDEIAHRDCLDRAKERR